MRRTLTNLAFFAGCGLLGCIIAWRALGDPDVLGPHAYKPPRRLS